jgi:RimJ/RimL family protein N-acetyltransferase
VAVSAITTPVGRVRSIAGRLRADGPSATLHLARQQLWSSDGWFDLRADLSALPEPRRARLPLLMEPCADPAFSGFEEEQRRVSGYDLEQVRQRQAWLEAGVRTLYVAWSEGRPAYCQWLLYPEDLPTLAAANPSAEYEPLREDEVLLEGAYTFVNFRGAGAMADCMGQLVRIAAEDGRRTAYTCVAADNVPSLKGCARVGFEPARLRTSVWRLGRHRLSRGPGHESEAWRAIGPGAAQ